MAIRTKLNYSTAEKDFSYASDYKNVQESLESSKKSYLDQVAKNEANIKAMYGKVDTEVGQYTSGQEGVAINNPGIDFQETWGDSKQEYAALNRKIVAGVGTVEDRARLSKLDATVDGTKNFVANLLVQTQNYDIARENPGGEGGVDLTSLTNTPEKLLSMEILSGRASGSQKMIIDPNTLEQRLEVSDSKGKLLNTVDAKQLSTSLDAGGAGNIDLLKDARPQQTAVVQNLKNKESGKIDNSLYIGSEGIPETFSKEITLADGTKKIQYYNKLNVESVKNKLFIPTIAAAEGFISENQNNPQAISSYYNSILGPSQIDFITGKPVAYEPFESGEYTGTDDQKEKFKKAFLNNTFNDNIVKNRDVKMEKGMVATPEVNKGRGSGSGDGGISSRALEIRNQLEALIPKKNTNDPNGKEGVLMYDSNIDPAKVAKVINKYGINEVLTLQQIKDQGLDEKGLEDRDKDDQLFVLYKEELKPIKAFTKNPTIKGLVEGYRNILEETGASAADKKAWNTATADLYNVDSTQGKTFNTGK